MRELQIEQLQEDHRKEVAIAGLEEIELMTKSYADGSGTGKMSEFFKESRSVKSKKLVQDWVSSSPAGNMADVANEPSLHFSGSIAQSNQAIVQRPSSTQPLRSHSTLNTHVQVEANINLTVHEPHEPSSRTNVTNNAHAAKNIMQEQRQPQYTPPSAPINFGMPTQLSAPNTARKLSQATMHFDGLQLDHEIPRRSSMPGQVNLVSPPHSPSLNALVNAPLATNPLQAYIKVPAPSSPVLNPVPTHFPSIHQHSTLLLRRHKHSHYTPMTPWRIMSPHSVTPFSTCTLHFIRKRFCTSFNSSTAPTKVFPVPKFCPYNPRHPNSVTHSPPAIFISSTNVLVPQLIHPPPPSPKDVPAPKFCPYNPRTSFSSVSKCVAFSGSSPI